jgi:cell division protein FtsA
VANGRRGVSAEDIDRALQAARAIAIPHSQGIIHAIPRSYTLDGQDGIRDPLGMQGYRLEVEAHIITGAKTSVNNLIRCVQSAEVEVGGLAVQGLASGEAVLTPHEREMGVVLADIGGGTTDIGVFIGGTICHTVILPVAGNLLTKDLAIGLRAPFTTAEEVKRRFGHAMGDSVPKDQAIEVATFGEVPRETIPRTLVAEILEARAEEILSLIVREIKRSGYDGLLPAGIVLCGGTSNLAGLRDLTSSVLGLPTRVGSPTGIEGLVEKISDPAYATSVGLLLWALKEGQKHPTQNKASKQGWTAKILDWLRAFLPE